MPRGQFIIADPGATPRLQATYSDLENRRLTSITAYLQFPVLLPVTFFIRLGITTDNDINKAIATLAQGYLTNIGHVSWTGSLIIDPSWQIFATALGNGNLPIICSFTTEDL